MNPTEEEVFEAMQCAISLRMEPGSSSMSTVVLAAETVRLRSVIAALEAQIKQKDEALKDAREFYKDMDNAVNFANGIHIHYGGSMHVRIQDLLDAALSPARLEADKK